MNAPEPTSLEHYTLPLRPFLDAPEVSEVCMNAPGQLWVERGDEWRCVEARWGTYAWALHFARLLATATRQRLSAEHPLLTATLPSGERVQVVAPPATRSDVVVIAIRKPLRVERSLSELAAGGLLARCRAAGTDLTGHAPLQDAFARGDWLGFLRLAVRRRLNVLISGATGSGKTTLTRALIREIDTCERLITIEDAPELALDAHPNSVRLFYSKDDQGQSRLSPRQLLEASLRLRPERILLAELRGEEAYQYLRSVNSGHPGSITSIHAGSCRLAFEQLALLVWECPAGREMRRRDVQMLLRQVVDVVVQCVRRPGGRSVEEVWWRAAPKHSASRRS